jgi:hypothetical protein
MKLCDDLGVLGVAGYYEGIPKICFRTGIDGFVKKKCFIYPLSDILHFAAVISIQS